MAVPFACYPADNKALSLSEIRFFTAGAGSLTGAHYANREKAGRTLKGDTRQYELAAPSGGEVGSALCKSENDVVHEDDSC
jgi:hypothetical protein